MRSRGRGGKGRGRGWLIVQMRIAPCAILACKSGLVVEVPLLGTAGGGMEVYPRRLGYHSQELSREVPTPQGVSTKQHLPRASRAPPPLAPPEVQKYKVTLPKTSRCSAAVR